MTNSFSLHKYVRAIRLTSYLRPFLAHIILGTTLFLAGCAQQSQAPQQAEPITVEALEEAPMAPSIEPTSTHQQKADKVAILLPLSGQHQALGQSLEHAAEMSLFDHDGDLLTVAIYDTKSTPQGAQDAALKAIEEGAGLILGPVLSDHVPGVAQLARRAGVNVVALSNNKSIAGIGVFALGLSPEEQINRILSYATSQGKRKIAALVPRSTYGALVEQELQTLKQQQSLEIDIVSYDAGSQNLIHNLNPLKTLQIDALFIPEGAPNLTRILMTLAQIGVPLNTVQLLGSSQWDTPQTLTTPQLRGAWIAGADPADRASFEQRYAKAYGGKPNRLATLTYDAIAMLAALKRHYGAEAFETTALTQNRGFSGLDGLFRFQQNGTAERKLAILQITPQGFKVLQGGDSSF